MSRRSKAEREADDLEYRAQAERRSAASRRVRETAHKLFGLDVGCGDGGCVFGHLGGQHTNGGCRCLYGDDHTLTNAQRLARIAHALATEAGT